MSHAVGPRFKRFALKVAAEDGSYGPIDLEATYTVATNAYMADGGENYTVFGEAKADGRQTDLFIVDYDAFTGYLATLETVAPSVEGRITRVFIDAGTVIRPTTPSKRSPRRTCSRICRPAAINTVRTTR